MIVSADTLYASAFTVTDMDMGVLVANSLGEQEDEGIIFPTNPFATTHHSEIGVNQATTIYDVLWNDNGGDFDFQFDHTIQDGPVFVESSSSGTIIFNTHTDVMLEYDFEYAFSNLIFPIDAIARIMVVRATEQPPSDNLVAYLETGGSGPTNGAGATGTFALDGRLLLPANNRFRISYNVIFTAGGDTSRIGVGSGSLHYSLTSVPEPMTVSLLLFGWFAMCRGSRRVRSSAGASGAMPPLQGEHVDAGGD